MTTVRQRKKINPCNQNQIKPHSEKSTKFNIQGISSPATWRMLCYIVGGMFALIFGLLMTYYVATLHENDLWFSSIKEVEREISFRTECGLYYSYYKQMLYAPSLKQGITNLIYDNKTESMRTINILARMNVYQEVILAILYKYLPFWNYLEPVYFYIYTVFGLQTMYVTALYINSWLLSGTWLSGALTALWYIVNRVDTTRVEFTIPLRENWALPFFAVQIAGITYLLRSDLTAIKERMAFIVVFISTFMFSLTWQFNQFVLLIQALVLFILDCADLIPATKVTRLYLIQVICLLVVCLLQFVNTMILGSLLLSFVLAAVLMRRLQKRYKGRNPVRRIWNLTIHVVLVLCLTVFINKITKNALNLQSDEHIFKFIQAKLGFGRTRDFDASLYLCEEAFRQLPFDTFERFSDTLLLYPYIFVLFILTLAAVTTIISNLRSPESNNTDKKEKRASFVKSDVAYNLIHTILFGCLALSTMRMKYLWTSHVCVFASFGLFSIEVWGIMLRCLRLYTPQRTSILRYSVSIFVIIYLLLKFWPRIMEELSELREFYDPDTVQLMNWIKLNTPNNAVFAGSMQLLAGVKLCTGRVLTNHPHYEDKPLRERTKQIMDGPGDNDPDLKPSPSPRFCDEIKRDLPSYTKHFTRVFKNKTFHVYRLSRKAAVK
ncbi:hypothetical protein GDO86_008173 [Hymenochirus boettgeri]|uniref:C-mannosyltransferase DPY19L3 n=1 Tax=Hymenochirus boettgeri TaxID=247094 RepID=A0A8T2IWP3_9PIPI|nr:hypothetical protein GDO86_008173 [Hymenochirus boettgeri]